MADQSPSSVLRQAAARIREMAAAATPGPWRCHDGFWPMPVGYVMAVLPADHADYRGPLVIAPTMSVDPDMAARNALANSQWMALVSPAIAEPLATMLNGFGVRCDGVGPHELLPYDITTALALARLILGATDDD